MMNWKKIVVFACGIALLPIVALALLSALSRRTSNLGAVGGKLAPCPNSPNCVSSQSADAGHRIEPIAFSGPPEAALARMKTLVASLPRTVVVTETGDYLHVEFRSALFRFVDDVEFLVDADAGQIHFRSASRAGHGDMGVNRRRMEAIRIAWQSGK